ncbi:hypothetical protein DB347_13545 [Opitutaceae bacterium EW11]|nr:hypothetical protein DB347_13545 [Opitutaceae bacterium EW11]
MFDDARSKRVIVVAHCLLNQCAISDGTADFPSQFREIVELLLEHQIGIIQLPCPELLCLGLERQDARGASRPLLQENSRIRNLMDSEQPRNVLQQKAEELASHLSDYQRHGFVVLGLLGVDRSPSCGVDTTSIGGKEMPGKGVFIEVIEKTLARHGVGLCMIGTKTGEKERSVERVKRFLAERFEGPSPSKSSV